MSNEEPIAAREIISTRLIEAPRALVWQAFANPKHLARWWGPDGFSNTFAEFDLRPDGEWIFVMHGPDGVDYPNHSIFEKVTPASLITFEHLGPAHPFHMIMRLDEEGPMATRVTWHMIHETIARSEAVRGFVPEAMAQNLARLAEEVARMQSLAQ